MRILSVFLICFFTSTVIFAQVSFPEKNQEEKQTPEILKRLHVSQDERLEKMLNWHIEKNNKMDGIEGFRVEIFSSSNLDAREKAENIKVEYLTKYSNDIVYVIYYAPNFKVRIGDFRTKNEALKLYNKIKKNYPSSFIVTDNIKFPLLKPLSYERPD